jgi:ADP-ribose pyrophosphatase YjhB (NUDIX family)
VSRALRRAALLASAVPDWLWTAWLGFFGARLGRRVEIVQAVILRGDAVLLSVRRDLRGWEIPGGNVDPGESAEEALRREVLEETGVEVAIEALSGVYHRTGFLPHRARVYRCRAVAGALQPSDETPRVAWWPTSSLPADLLPWCRAPVADALAGAAEPAERTEHQGVRQILESARIDLAARLRGD